jgi:peptide/nickel transport system permease protein
MTNYIIRRMVGVMLTIFAVSIASFGLIKMSPGDPALLLIASLPGQERDETMLSRVRRQYSLDLPIHVQYIRYISNLLRGDLGYSQYFRRPTTDLLLARLPVTSFLAASIMIAAMGLGIPLGLLAALRRDQLFDNFFLAFSMVVLSVPSFFLALILIFIFGFTLKLLPTSGYQTPAHFVLPVLSVALPLAVNYASYLRTSVLTYNQADFVRTAHAKGLHQRIIVFRHILRNALLPVITVASLDMAYLLTGVVIIESIFNIPGIGMTTSQAALRKDIPVMMGSIIFGAIIIGVSGLLADLLAARLDPRIALE